MGFMGGSDPVSSAILTLGAGLLGGNNAPDTPQVQQAVSPLLAGLSDPLLNLIKQRLAEVEAAQSPATTAANQAYFDKNQTAQQKATPYPYASSTPTAPVAPTAPTIAKTIKQSSSLSAKELNDLNAELKSINPYLAASPGTNPTGFNPSLSGFGSIEMMHRNQQNNLVSDASKILAKYGINNPTAAAEALYGKFDPNKDNLATYRYNASQKSFTNDNLSPYLTQTEVANPEYDAAMAKYNTDLKAYNDAVAAQKAKPSTPATTPVDQTQTGQYPSTTSSNPLISALAKATANQTSYQPAYQQVVSNYPKLPADVQTNATSPNLYAELKNKAEGEKIMADQAAAKNSQDVLNSKFINYIKNGGTADYDVWLNQGTPTAPSYSEQMATAQKQAATYPTAPQQQTIGVGGANPTTPKINTQPAQSAGQTLTPAQAVQNNAQFDVAKTFAANNGVFNDYYNPDFMRPKTSTDYAGQMTLGTDPLELALQANFISKLDKEYLPATDIAEAQQGVKQLISAPNSSSGDIANLITAANRLGQNVSAGPSENDLLARQQLADRMKNGIGNLDVGPTDQEKQAQQVLSNRMKAGAGYTSEATANEELARQQLAKRMQYGTGQNLAETLYQQAMNPYMRELQDQQKRSANSLASRGLYNSTVVDNVNENLNKVYADRAKDIALGSQIEATKMNEAAITDAINQSNSLENAIKAQKLQAAGLNESAIMDALNQTGNMENAIQGRKLQAVGLNEAAKMDALNQSNALENALRTQQLQAAGINSDNAKGQANIFTTINNMRRSDQSVKSDLLNQSVNMALQRQNADQTALQNLQDIMTKQENRRIFNIQNPQNIWQQNVNNNQNAVSQAINAANGIGVPLTSMQNQNNMAGYQQQIAGQTQMNQLLGQVGAGLFGNKGGSTSSSTNVSNPFNVTVPDYKLPDVGISYSPYKPTLNKY